MKIFVGNFSLFLIISLSIALIDSAQPSMRRSEAKKAVLLAYKPNSEIQTKDENNKSWTYKIPGNELNASEELNRKLMELFVEQKLKNMPKNKRDNHMRQTVSTSSESIEEIDDAKVVEVKNEDKKTCYKNTYKNVLNAFEDALKSQIHNYKKCACQKKLSTTTSTTTTTTTTEAPSEESPEADFEGRSLGNAGELEAAIDHPDDVVCFHKQYAFMLNKLLDTIPCKKAEIISPADDGEYHGETKSRNERQSPRQNNIDENDGLKDQIKAIMKEYLSTKKVTTTTTSTTTTPKPMSMSIEDEISDEEKFFEKLRRLFQQLETDDPTFPVSKNKSTQSQSAVAVPLQKSPRKAAARKYRRTSSGSHEHRQPKVDANRKVVTEHSDESTESTFKLKKGTPEMGHSESEEIPRDDRAKITKSSKHSSSSSKSYRTTSRSTEIARNNIDEKENSSEEEASQEAEERRGGGDADDDRLATHLAKTISDFAKRYMKQQ